MNSNHRRALRLLSAAGVLTGCAAEPSGADTGRPDMQSLDVRSSDGAPADAVLTDALGIDGAVRPDALGTDGPPPLEACPAEQPERGMACAAGLTCNYQFRCCCADYVPQTRCECVGGRFVCGESGACDPPPPCADASPLCPPGLDAGRID